MGAVSVIQGTESVGVGKPNPYASNHVEMN